MSKELAEHDKLAYRLTQILVKLNNGESLDPLALADEFGVHPRTIQRDLNTRFFSLACWRRRQIYHVCRKYTEQANSKKNGTGLALQEINVWAIRDRHN